jgi:hypothetical protein
MNQAEYEVGITKIICQKIYDLVAAHGTPSHITITSLAQTFAMACAASDTPDEEFDEILGLLKEAFITLKELRKETCMNSKKS